MLIKVTILTDRAALPEADDGVLKIEDEESFNANPFYTNPFYTCETDLGKTIGQFAINEQWQPAQDDNDPWFRTFAEPPGTLRPPCCQNSWIQRSRTYIWCRLVGKGVLGHIFVLYCQNLIRLQRRCGRI